MKYTEHSHQRGNSKLPQNLQEEIRAAISKIRSVPATGKVKGDDLKIDFLNDIQKTGWSVNVKIALDSKMTITSKKLKVGLCFQTGNMGRMYADLMKLQKLYHDDAIKAAAILIPSKKLSKRLGDNISNADRLLRELEVFVKVYDVPTLVFELQD